MTDFNGAYQVYADKTEAKIFFKNTARRTKTLTILSGQVLKARSFIQTDTTTGKGIAHSGVSERANVVFADILDTKTVILAGLTFTSSDAGGTPKADLVTAFAGLTAGMTAAQANAANPVATGSFTSGTLTGYNVELVDAVDEVLFVSTTAFGGVTDLADSGNGSGTTITVTAADASRRIAGVTLMDVDASGGDVDTTVYTEASFWADALVWKVDPTVDTITLADGSTVACTHYNTGCAGISSAAILLQKKFVEGSGFEQLGYIKAGEQY